MQTLLEARNHVNRMCLSANKPLIESGSAGYLGQVSVIMKVYSHHEQICHWSYHIPAYMYL